MLLRDALCRASLLVKPPVGVPSHALGLAWDLRNHPRLAAKPHFQLVGPTDRTIEFVLVTARVGETVAMPAKEVPVGTV